MDKYGTVAVVVAAVAVILCTDMSKSSSGADVY